MGIELLHPIRSRVLSLFRRLGGFSPFLRSFESFERSVSCRLVCFSKSIRRVLFFPRVLVVINPTNNILIPLACSKSFFSAQMYLTRWYSCWKRLRCGRFFGGTWLDDTLFSGVPSRLLHDSIAGIVGLPFARRFLDLGSYALEVIVRSGCKC